MESPVPPHFFILPVFLVVKLLAAEPPRMCKFRPEPVPPGRRILAAAAVLVTAKLIHRLRRAAAIVHLRSHAAVSISAAAATAPRRLFRFSRLSRNIRRRYRPPDPPAIVVAGVRECDPLSIGHVRPLPHLNLRSRSSAFPFYAGGVFPVRLTSETSPGCR